MNRSHVKRLEVMEIQMCRRACLRLLGTEYLWIGLFSGISGSQDLGL